MLRTIKKIILAQKQAVIRRYPAVTITLHPDMPHPSLSKMAELARVVAQVNALEPSMSALSDAALRAKTEAFRERIARSYRLQAPHLEELKAKLQAAALNEEKEKIKLRIKQATNKAFEEVLPEAFAAVREASRRTIGLRHFDVQIAGGIVLHEGRIAEMSTGEGKTLVATLPAYLNALSGKGVHIVTVNDYLARRDREWMGPIYDFLGLTVGVIQHEMSDEARRLSYACDITYGTNNEFGFDYLRDNMKYSLQDLVQRPFYYAIVDEVDSILVDEARTPLIISGPAEESTDKYYTADRIVPSLKGKMVLEREEIEAKHKGLDVTEGFDYVVDEKAHTVYLTDGGEARACQLLGVESLHDMETMDWRHHIIQALHAHSLYRRDVDYVLRQGQVVIVDEFTGRMMPGRRWSDGLHQAVEAKEGVKIERENQTLATVTFQNYFRMYEKCAGMTGTAFTEASEFKAIYQLEVVVIPTNRPLIRGTYPDRVYKSEQEKFKAVVDEIVELNQNGQPILVGTVSIDRSEFLSELLKRKGVEHQVLNAKYHEMEAHIIAQAGRFKGVTIATNMAGRGTDILLGGNPEHMAKNLMREKMPPSDPAFEQEYRHLLEKYRQETRAEHEKVVSLGGLHVIGTERHEARRIDNQLRGRCGRQGDPGSSRFYVSLGDDLMRLFGSDRITGIMERLGLEEGQAIEHPWVSGSIEIAQKRVETHNFEIRRQLLEYDNVMNKQREVIYTQRRQILEGASLKENIVESLEQLSAGMVDAYMNEARPPEEWDFRSVIKTVASRFGVSIDEKTVETFGPVKLKEYLLAALLQAYEEKERRVGEELIRHLERTVYLNIIDLKWKEHLYAMDGLREGIGLRAYGQRDPLVEYKREGFTMFNEMIAAIEETAVEAVFRAQPHPSAAFTGVFRSIGQQLLHPEARRFEVPPQEDAVAEPPAFAPQAPASAPVHSPNPKVGRNDPCPCGAKDHKTGSPIKYKKCHGR